MIVITEVSERYFSLNGVNYAKIYQPLKQGVSALGIYNVNDTRQQLISSTVFSDFEINGNTYGTIEETIAALLPVVYLENANFDYSVNNYNGDNIVNEITNNADEEFITASNLKLKLKDTNNYKFISKTFDWSIDLSVYESKNIEIRFDFDLQGQTISFPKDVTLVFKGGSFSNGVISINQANIISGNKVIFKSDLIVRGSYKNKEINPAWFGVVGDGVVDDSVNMQRCVDFVESNDGGVVLLNSMKGYVLHNITVKDGVSILGSRISQSKAVDKCLKIMPPSGVTTGVTFIMRSQTSIKNIMFFASGQKYSLALDTENFNNTPLAVQLGDAVRTVQKGITIENVGVIGYLDFIKQDSNSLNIESLYVNNIFGMPLRHAFQLNLSYDINNLNNINFNLNSYRNADNTNLITGTVSNYFYKVASTASTFRLGRVDDLFGSNIFVYGVKKFLHFIKDAYTGDTNNGGGVTFSNVSCDAVVEGCRIDRSNMNFAVKWSGGFIAPLVKVIDGTTRAAFKFSLDSEFCKILASNINIFSNEVPMLGDSTKSGSSDYYIRWETSGSNNSICVSGLRVAEYTSNIVTGANKLVKNYYSFPALIKTHNLTHRQEQDGSFAIEGDFEAGTGKGLSLVSASGTVKKLTVLDDGTFYAESARMVKKVGIPATSTSSGLVGDIAADGSFLYICIATNSWVRTNLATW